MSKVIEIKQRGYVWHVPIEVIANDRAKWYAKDDEEYKEEYEFTLKDTYAASDWFFNNMNWEDVEDKATLVHIPDPFTKPDFSEEFESSTKDV